MDPTRSTSYNTVPGSIIAFLQETLPFSELSRETLEHLARSCLIDYFPLGTIILKQGETEVTSLYLIQSGGVKVYLADEDKLVTLQEFGGRGEAFGVSSLVNSRRAELTVEAVEDTFCLLIDRQTFFAVLQANPRFASYYEESLSDDFIKAAYSEQRLEKVGTRAEDSLRLFNNRALDLVRSAPQVVSAAATVHQVGRLMAARGVTSVLVQDTSGKPVGTVSNVDLRSKVVAQGLDYDTTVDKIMSSPVETVPALALSFEAVMKMLERGVDHVAVIHHQDIVGMINGPDMMVHMGSSPLYLFRSIDAQTGVDGLQALAQRLPALVRSLLESGARAGSISQMLTVFHDRIVARILKLVEAELGDAPVRYEWLGLGSEGRKEQSFRTDQDNAIVYEDLRDHDLDVETQEYLRAFAQRAVAGLEQSGSPRCKNQFMASNERWCKPWSSWKEYFREWIMTPMPPEIYLSTIFFDFRCVAGRGRLTEELMDYVQAKARRYPLFLKYFARYFLLNEPPLSFYDDSVVEKDGARIPVLDLKTRSLLPFVDFARIMALLHGIRETNTLARFRDLCDRGHIPRNLYLEARQAYEYALHLMLVHQLRKHEAGEEPDNVVRPSDLSNLERKTIKFSFSVVERLMDFVREELRVNARTKLPIVAKPMRGGSQ